MGKDDVVIDELGFNEKKVLLKAFDYDVDKDGFILDSTGSKIRSEEQPSRFLHVAKDALVPGSLKIIDGTPTSIAKFLRERLERPNGGSGN